MYATLIKGERGEITHGLRRWLGAVHDTRPKDGEGRDAAWLTAWWEQQAWPMG